MCETTRANHMCETTRANLAPGDVPVATGPSEQEEHHSHAYPMPIRTRIVSDQHHYVYTLTRRINDT